MVVALSAVGVLTVDDSADVGPLAAEVATDVAARAEIPRSDALAESERSTTGDPGVATSEGSRTEISSDAPAPEASSASGDTSDVASEDDSRARRDLAQRDGAPTGEVSGDRESSPSTALAPTSTSAPASATPVDTGVEVTPVPSSTSTSLPGSSIPVPLVPPRVPADSGTGGTTAPGSSDPVSGALASLAIRDETPRSGYARELFSHWNDPDGNGCDARQDVLSSQLLGFAQRDLVDFCVIVEGDWWSIYDGVTHEGSPSELDVDHVVSLAEAWDSGANAWSAFRRSAFANDPLNLVAVTASSNRSKSDRDVGEWRPPRRDAWCFTARTTVQVKARYDLSVDAREAAALAEMLSTCTASSPDPRSGVPAAVPTPTPAPSVPSVPPPASSTTSAPATPVPVTPVPVTTVPATCVDINSASAVELERIVHIGESRAQQILGLRPFASVEDLVRVSGIGASRLADILDQGLACVGS